jgi:hypothetical protein
MAGLVDVAPAVILDWSISKFMQTSGWKQCSVSIAGSYHDPRPLPRPLRLSGIDDTRDDRYTRLLLRRPRSQQCPAVARAQLDRRHWRFFGLFTPNAKASAA